mmetsp:Transcript_13331/g.42296  ORF Transcript_13331/g.42296 Transcript_13331/m.42296 type:complete len:1633 (+) Transcript_13331:103-5001(+)|eukprot:CAMPEP_0182878516 /NCGR_PEP_ID=MMETSP0034_2-20130328/15396_1 /TAXON_ID=156128 /ORGANISM="Nephroselmis pyriformis, Strain CCMP717" /LENGTH=1632 /DNA_ID=CAMNT_0025011403 /DNA_START=58 /DNA_END=4956 /DNA_ORIENTATION=+
MYTAGGATQAPSAKHGPARSARSGRRGNATAAKLPAGNAAVASSVRAGIPQFSGFRTAQPLSRQQPSFKPALASRGQPVTTSVAASPSDAAGKQPYVPQVAMHEDLLKERDACGVGLIASLKNTRSHKTVADALTALGCMEHRGACSADNDSGDGAGVMVQIPWGLLKAEGFDVSEEDTCVAQVFLPKDAAKATQSKAIFEAQVKKEGFTLVGWRPVPVDNDVVGEYAQKTQPDIEQAILKSDKRGDDLERACYLLRKGIEKDAVATGDQAVAEDFYICTLSNRTIVYKGMLRSAVLGPFYKDLTNPAFESAFAIYHRRFSTNTTPKWPLAQPMRFLGHNGEINTLLGNLNWTAAREASFAHPVWEGREDDFKPLTNSQISDSGNLDRVAELLVRTGTGVEKTMMLLVPEAFRNHPDLEVEYPEVTDFYEFYQTMQEGWDGPALLVFSDGKKIGMRLDRNGLRPARFWQTADDMVYIASEVGVLGDVFSNAANITKKGRLGPGQMVSVCLETGTFKESAELSREVATSNPYGDWNKKGVRPLKAVAEAGFKNENAFSSEDVLRMQTAFGYSSEDVEMIINEMAGEAKEPTFCMGDDTPMPAFTPTYHMMYDYVRQRFAQVTNPPIDSLREGLVMSVEMTLGKRGNLLMPGPDSVNQILLPSPVLTEAELEGIVGKEGLGSATISTFYTPDGKPGALKAAIDDICAQAAKAVEGGAAVVVLSDRPGDEGIQADRPAIPALLITGAVHHHLIRAGLRMDTSIIVDTAQAFSTHHMACLVGYGASAICPYLGWESCRQWRSLTKTENMMQRGKLPEVSVRGSQRNFRKSLNAGLLKILSKMGISLLSSYHGAQIFEIYGLGPEVVDTGFRGSVSRIGGLNLDDVSREVEAKWAEGFPEENMKKLINAGFIQARTGLEYHHNNQDLVKLLHKAIREQNDEAYDMFQSDIKTRPITTLRDGLEIISDRKPISIDEVEPAADIMKRFCTGGMSLGAISRETHETIAIAMNRIGGKSNSGEGGEDPIRFEKLSDVAEDGVSPTVPYLKGLENGDIAFSKIKQVASGRFGVTPNFLMNAEQLEIKVAQGAKPGEGGQLPGKKVSPYIAGLRRSKAGVPLISPPPHHDIYSIEDLAQLIFDLHQINPEAKVSVKLVAEIGIGTIASGVAKANADVIQISGHDGGTGASPISSVKHAGGPWEMGLVETHQTLLANGLRERVILRVDGGFKSGFDVLMSALMGGDEYGFGTVAMIATGCIMARVCHTNNCPVGVASQREELRARFPGVPGDVVNYFHYVTEEVRQTLADMGYKSLDEVIGRADLLKQKEACAALPKTSGIDLGYLLQFPNGQSGTSSERIAQAVHSNGDMLDDKILADPEVLAAIANETSVSKEFEIINVDRAACGRVAGQIALKHGDNGFAGEVALTFKGSAGQSFGVFAVGGMKVTLIGEANDGVCKGMGGGMVAIRPPADLGAKPEDCSLAGNTCLYGATGGMLFVNGRAGERFAVRNSLAMAVVEGVGDHCCEYMTGGAVVVLGAVGRNVAAGMTGGIGYFLDEDGSFPSKVNGEIVAMQRVGTEAAQKQLKELISMHVAETGSPKGQRILDSWGEYVPKFWQLVPPSEQGTPEGEATEVTAETLKVAA